MQAWKWFYCCNKSAAGQKVTFYICVKKYSYQANLNRLNHSNQTFWPHIFRWKRWNKWASRAEKLFLKIFEFHLQWLYMLDVLSLNTLYICSDLIPLWWWVIVKEYAPPPQFVLKLTLPLIQFKLIHAVFKYIFFTYLVQQKR